MFKIFCVFLENMGSYTLVAPHNTEKEVGQMETPVVQPRDWTCWSCLVCTACTVELLNLVTAANGASTAS